MIKQLLTVLLFCSCQSNPSPKLVKGISFETKNNDSFMEEEAFWKHIDKIQNGQSLRDIINGFPPNKIIAFTNRFDFLMSKAYDYKIWGAAYLIYGGCSDDCFMDFRSSLIMQGKKRYYQALQNPDDITWLSANELNVEDLPHVILYETYRLKTGKELKTSSLIKYELKGKPFDEEQLDKLYPKLFKKFAGRTNEQDE